MFMARQLTVMLAGSSHSAAAIAKCTQSTTLAHYHRESESER